MGYIPTEWQTGDTITAEKLNKAEEGIAAASPVVLNTTIDDSDTLHLGKSWDDLMDLSGVPVFAQVDISATDQNRYFLARLYAQNGSYFAVFVTADASHNPSSVVFSSITASAEMVVVD